MCGAGNKTSNVPTWLRLDVHDLKVVDDFGDDLSRGCVLGCEWES